MNKIGFNQKHRSKRYFSVMKNLSNLLNFFTPIIITILVIFCIFIFIPKTAWISATGSPTLMEVNDFKGRMDLKISSIQSKNKLNGYILNQSYVNLNLNNEEYVLNPGELIISYGNGDFYNNWDSIISSTTIQLDMLDMHLDELNIEKTSLFHKYDNLSKSYVLSIKDDDALKFSGIIYDKEFSWEIQGNCEIYIRGMKIQSDMPFYQLRFTQNSETHTFMQFEGFNDSYFLINAEKGKLLFTGESRNINVSFEEGNLDFNQTVNEKQFALKNKFLAISPINTEKLALTYTNDDQQILDIQGNIAEGTLTGSSLFLNFRQWIIENISTIIATLITMFLGFIIIKKK
ncbi:hypothetical protein [Lysinibacillus sphaericus]|uniref:hypothetical protein n=1 Tax=Lysinibacillus sphaericus TaxID=1421 RepID=UPI000C1923B6|nr:hypothetical protein [Lysinibacillus sphaericus]PIJ98210.1 hypothetical protein CTN02_09235 [Lysinibacillus sphaericus]